jgi:hypothetical protein
MDDEDGKYLAQILNVLSEVGSWVERTSPGSARLRAVPRSPLRGDDDRSHPHDLSHTAWRHLSTAVDHLSCLQVLLGDAKVIHKDAPFTLVRGALENACGAVWLLQPPRRKERLTRLFRLAIADIRYEYQAGELMGQASSQDMQKPIDEVVAIAERAGIEAAAVKKSASYTEIVSDVDKSSPGSLVLLTWKTCSGYAHGDWWTTKNASRRTRIPGPPLEGIGTFKIEANLGLLMKMTAIAVTVTRLGWHLHDRSCRSPYS